MSCLTNLIGLRGYCEDTTPSGALWINDLPGISLKMIAGFTNEEQQTFSGVWDEIISDSISDFESEVLVRMQKYFKTNILIDNEVFGFYKKDYPVEASDNNWKGATIKLIGSKYTEIFINSIQLRLENVTNPVGTIKIFDVQDGRTLDTISFTAIDGLNEVEIRKKYQTNGQRKYLLIAFDGEIADSIETSYASYYDWSSYAVARGAEVSKASSVIEGNITFSGNTHGMVVNFNVECSVSSFICSNTNLFKKAFQYRLGARVMQERLGTDRINRYTMNNAETAKENRDNYLTKMNSILDAVLNNMDNLGDSICFVCNKKRTYQYQLP